MTSQTRYGVPSEELQLLDTETKLQGFEALPAGWHYGEGGPLDREVVGLAASLLTYAFQLGLTETDAFPGLAGEARLTLYSDDDYFELTINCDQSVTFVHERKGFQVSEEEDLSIDQARGRLLQNLRGHQWTSSASSIVGTMTVGSADFKALPLPHQAMEGSPLSTGHVYWIADAPSVSIADSTTKKEFRGTRRSSGNSTGKYSPITIA